MEKLIPYFEINGRKYELKQTRYLMAEYNKLREELSLTEEEKLNGVKIEKLSNELVKYGEKVAELEEKYFSTFDDEDERRYLKAKNLYDMKFAELAELEASSGSSAVIHNKSLDILEKITILGLAEQHFDKDYSAAKELWERFVDENGEDIAIEWLIAMAQCLFVRENEGETKNDFLTKMRKRQSNRK